MLKLKKMDLITALDEAIENVVKCAWAVEETEGTAAASERFERVARFTEQAVRKRKREECAHMKEKEFELKIETLEPDPPAGTD